MAKIISLIVLLFVFGMNYACMKLAQINPDIISGFKMSKEPEQRTLDEAWLKEIFRYMSIANIITLMGGTISIVLDLNVSYYLFLFLPYCLALLVGCLKRKDMNGKKNNKKAIIIIFATVFTVCLPILYTYGSDLDITISDKEISIGGLYGLAIPLNDIKETKLCSSLPNISTKTNGFALAKTRLGHFRTTNGKDIMLFTHSDTYFVRIVRANGATYYLSFKSKEATDQLFMDLQKKNGNRFVN